MRQVQKRPTVLREHVFNESHDCRYSPPHRQAGRTPRSAAQKLLQNPNLPRVQGISYPGLLDARTIINEYDLDADLVTLSACQTALGQLTGEGLIGFTRAFLTSGARSFWPVYGGSMIRQRKS